jgi:translation initiation factor 4E
MSVIETTTTAKPAEHKLQTTWTLYFDKKIKAKEKAHIDGQAPSSPALNAVNFDTFKHNMKNLGSFSSVEGFWEHFRWLQQPESLPKGMDCYLFRENLLPAWESFPNGGCWIVRVRKKNGVINRLWEEICFSIIAEQFGIADIVGVTLSTRGTYDNISIWNKTNDDAIKLAIGQKMKQVLNLDASTLMNYKAFNAALQDGSMFRNTQKYVFTKN